MVHTSSKRYEAVEKSICNFLGALVLAVMPSFAMAADGTGIFCWVADYLKQIVGVAAMVAIGMWAIEHVFGVSKIHDIVMRVGVACGFVVVAALWISKSGLVVNC